ncbi:hypothetical protein KAJ27_20285 [bacterium]|nr:hypothetical protein [bacterium]
MSFHIECLQDDIEISKLSIITDTVFLRKSETIIQNTLDKVIIWDRKLVNSKTIYASLFNGKVFLRNTEKLIYKSKRLPSRSTLVKRYLWIIIDIIKMKMIVTVAGSVEE